MIELVLIGSGGYALEIEDQILDCLEAGQGLFDGAGQPLDLAQGARVAGLLDNGTGRYGEFRTGAPRLGDVETHEPGNYLYVIAIGEPTVRARYSKILKDRRAAFFTMVHPSAKLSSSARLAGGVVVGVQTYIGPKVTIGPHAAINVQCSIGHDATVEGYAAVSPKCAIGGGGVLGPVSFMGTAAVINPRVRVGRSCKVAAGSVVYADQPDGSLIVGNPAKGRQMLPIEER
jgi:sugar O-acyltransferase (sialic acid O-acetyltransferase NeuD family)